MTTLSKHSNFKYLITNNTDSLWGLIVTTVGWQSIDKDFSCYPPQTGHPTNYFFNCKKGRILNEYQLLYITKGGGTFTNEKHETMQVNEGDMIFIKPYQWHSYSPDTNTGWDEYWIGFKGHNIDKRFMNGFFNPSQNIYHVGMQEEVLQLYKRAMQSANSELIGYQQVLSGIVNYIIGLMLSYDKNKIFEGDDVIFINKAKLIIRENIYEKITPEDVANKINKSYSWFRKNFKNLTGFSPASYIQELKLEIAKEKLRTTSLNIKEIAFMLNFESAEYFNSYFRKKNGLTPLKYRNNYRAKINKHL